MAHMLRSWKTCKPHHTSFNSQEKYAFRSSVVTSMCATLIRNHNFVCTFSNVSRILPTLVGSRIDLESFLKVFWSLFERIYKVRRRSFSCMTMDYASHSNRKYALKLNGFPFRAWHEIIPFTYPNQRDNSFHVSKPTYWPFSIHIVIDFGSILDRFLLDFRMNSQS